MRIGPYERLLANAYVGRSKSIGPSHVRYGSLADIGERIMHVRFTPESGHAQRHHQRLLSAMSRHATASRTNSSN